MDEHACFQMQHKLTQFMNKHRLASLRQNVSKLYQAALLSSSQLHALRSLVNMFDCDYVKFQPALTDAAIQHCLHMQPNVQTFAE